MDGEHPGPERGRQLVSPLGWAVALLGPVAVSLVLIPLRPDIRASNLSLVLVLVVVAAAILGGRTAGAIAAVMSALAFDFLFTRPFYSFTIHSRDDVETAVLLLLVGLVVGELVVRARRERTEAVASRAEVVRVRRLTELAAGGESAGRLIGIVQGELTALLGLRGCRFERPPFASELPELSHQGVRIPSSPEDASARGEVALPVFGGGHALGRFVLHLASGATGIALPPEDRALAAALADQLGTVLDQSLRA